MPDEQQNPVQEPISGGDDASLPGRYALLGPQMDPTAALWLDGVTRICVPTLAEITVITERPPSPGDRMALDFERDFPGSTEELDRQLAILRALAQARLREPYPGEVPVEGQPSFALTPLSRFLHLQPVPFGAVVVAERTRGCIGNVLEQHLRITANDPLVTRGRDLARLFESETPGLYHRHALNWILFNRADVSPPRQARMWMALDIAIYAALGAAWHYKWLRLPTSRLLRPKEHDEDLPVLFDLQVLPSGEDSTVERECPQPTPGTPRHPAWPSGHSTYSAAASHILEYFVSPESLTLSDADLFARYPTGPVTPSLIAEPGWIAAELRRLANNIGEARLWGGVHWYSDHVAGQKIGRAAAQVLIQQLQRDCIPLLEALDMVERCANRDAPPSNEEIHRKANRGGSCAGIAHDRLPPQESRGGAFRATSGNT